MFKTYAFSLYCHLCINVSMYLYSCQIYTWYIWTGCRRCVRAIRGVPEHDDRVNWEMQLEAEIEWTQQCTWRRRLSELRVALGGSKRTSLDMHMVAESEWTQRCNWRPWSSEFGDAPGGRNRMCLDMHLEAESEWTEWCDWRPWSSNFGDALGGRDWVNSEMHLHAVIVRVWRCTWRPLSSVIGGVLEGGWYDARQVLRLCSSVSYSNWQPSGCDEVSLPLSSNGELAGGSRSCKEARRKFKLQSGVNS